MPSFLTTLLASASVLGLSVTTAMAQPLIIYSPQGGERADWIAEQAIAAGHDVEILAAGGGELFDRLLAERNNPQADVVLGLVDTSMALLKDEGLFQPYTPGWAEGLAASGFTRQPSLQNASVLTSIAAHSGERDIEERLAVPAMSLANLPPKPAELSRPTQSLLSQP